MTAGCGLDDAKPRVAVDHVEVGASGRVGSCLIPTDGTGSSTRK